MKAILCATAVVCVTAGAGSAQDWRPLDETGIVAALTDQLVRYENGATQRFFASGRTLYTAAEPSWGQWRVENDQYCSLWPPAHGWDCYDMFADGAGGVDFADAWGNRFPGAIVVP